MGPGFGVTGKKSRVSIRVKMALVAVIILVLGVTSLTFRFDYAAGSHRIIPTAVDSDFWGNYRVYFRTSIMTRDHEEGHYYISRGNTHLAEQIRTAMLNNQEVMVFYDRYIGFKGFTAPKSSPITRIEIIGSGNP